jgi:fumarate reductase flavoprotein subunit
LFAINNGPYYAIRGKDAYFETLGGLRINENAQVIRESNLQPIQGLYATGHDAGGMYGDTYDLLMEGSSSSFAINSAVIAVEHIKSTLSAK